jgi:hypothetical protein
MDAVEALFRHGLTAHQVLARGVAPEPVVYRVRQQMGERGEIDYRPRPSPRRSGN